jgi:hypothetical protein
MTNDTIDEGKLRDLMNEVSALPTSIAPPADAWSKIRAEIEASGNPDSHPIKVIHIGFWQRPMFLAAAALLLIAGSSLVTTVALNRRATSTTSRVSQAAGSTNRDGKQRTGIAGAIHRSGERLSPRGERSLGDARIGARSLSLPRRLPSFAKASR